MSSRPVSARLRSIAVIVAVVVFAAHGCSDEDTAAKRPDAAASDAEPDCPAFAQRPDGTCCAKTEVYDFDSDACRAHGPFGCDLAAAAKGVPCVPKWCSAWRTAEGKPCDAKTPACFEVGDICPDAATAAKGCDAGTWRPKPDGPCVPAGYGDKALGDVVPPAGVPSKAPLPAIEATRFCGEGDAIRLCEPNEKGCGPGAMPDPKKKGACIKVGRPWDCPPGFVANDAGKLAPCVPDPKDCGGPWPPSGTGAALYVDKSAGKGGDGSKNKPFVSIAAAVAVAKAGTTILVNEGTYAESVQLKKSVSLVGRCAAKVTIDGTGGFGAVEIAGPVGSETEVTVVGLTLVGKSRGLHVQSVSKVTAARLYIREVWGVGLRVWKAGASLSAREIVVAGTTKGPKYGGLSSVIDEGAKAELRDVWLHGGQVPGLLIRNPGTEVDARRVVISHTNPLPVGGGSAVEVLKGAKLTMTSGRVWACRPGGMAVRGSGTHAALSGVIVDASRPASATVPGGQGIAVGDGATVDLFGVRISDNRLAGVHVGDTGTKLIARGLLVDATRKGMTVGSGGLRVYEGAQADVRDARLSGNQGFGARTAVGGAKLTMHPVLVDGSTSADSYCRGCAVDVSPASSATITDAWFTGNQSAGLAVSGEGAGAEATNVLVDTTRAPTGHPKLAGYGVVAHHGGTVVLRGARLHDNALLGARALNPGSVIVGVGVVIDGTRASAADRFGVGLQADGDAAIWFAGSHIANNHAAGVLVTDKLSSMQLHGLIVEDTQPSLAAAKAGGRSTKEFGAGVYVVGGVGKVKNVKLVSSIFRRNHLAGVQIVGANAHMVDCVAHDTVPSAAKWSRDDGAPVLTSLFADGFVANGATGSYFERNLLLNNKRAGVLISDAQNVKVVDNAMVRNTYGLATQKSQGHTIGHNAMIDNQQNVATAGALLVPKAPVPIPAQP